MEATHYLTFAPDALETHSVNAIAVRMARRHGLPGMPVTLLATTADPDNGGTLHRIMRGRIEDQVDETLGARLAAKADADRKLADNEGW